jgi:polyhydroxybutyrate depolymerase
MLSERRSRIRGMLLGAALIASALFAGQVLADAAADGSSPGRGATESGTAESGSADRAEAEILVGGSSRSYTLFVPDVTAQPAAPLVLVLHSRGGSGQAIAELTGFDQLAQEDGALVAYPDGLEGEWNYLTGRGGNTGVDDVRFLVELVRDISERYAIDSSRVYVAGFSNGGFMAQRLACAPESPFTAYASVAGAAFGGIPELCRTPGPMSLLLMHGTADRVVPWEGQVVPYQGRELLLSASVPQSFGFWAGHAGSGCRTERREVPPTGRSPETTVRLLIADDCPAGHRVVLYAVINGGHNWPGGSSDGAGGAVNRDIDGSEEIWRFFRETPERTSPSEGGWAQGDS